MHPVLLAISHIREKYRNILNPKWIVKVPEWFTRKERNLKRVYLEIVFFKTVSVILQNVFDRSEYQILHKLWVRHLFELFENSCTILFFSRWYIWEEAKNRWGKFREPWFFYLPIFLLYLVLVKAVLVFKRNPIEFFFYFW